MANAQGYTIKLLNDIQNKKGASAPFFYLENDCMNYLMVMVAVKVPMVTTAWSSHVPLP